MDRWDKITIFIAPIGLLWIILIGLYQKQIQDNIGFFGILITIIAYVFCMFIIQIHYSGLLYSIEYRFEKWKKKNQ